MSEEDHSGQTMKAVLAWAKRGDVPPPKNGELVGEPCPSCGQSAYWSVGNPLEARTWRTLPPNHLKHCPQGRPPARAAQEAPRELRGPTRVSLFGQDD